MAYIRNLPKGKYQICWRENVDGKITQRTQTYTDEKTAKRRKVDIERDIERGGTPAATAELAAKPLSHYAALYFGALVGPKPSKRTVYGYRQQYEIHIKPVFGSTPVAAIRIGDVKRFRAQLVSTTPTGKDTNRTANTASKIIGVLRNILQTALEDGAISSNPAKEVTVSRASDFTPERLTAEQVMSVHDYIADEQGNPVYALAVLFAAFTGLRAAELAGLEIGDLDLDATNPVVYVTRTKAKVKLEDDKAQGWVTGPTKSRKNRTVPLDGWLVTRLRDYLNNVHPGTARARKMLAHNTTAPLFPGRKRNQFNWSEPIDMNNLRKRYLYPALAALELPNARWHDLRGTFAVMSLQGDHYRDVSRWLGHEKISTTLDIYASVIPSEHGGKRAPLPEPTPAPRPARTADNVVSINRRAR